MAPKKSTIVLNVEQFIRDVEERPAIWNRNFHCNKAFLEQMWDELSAAHKLPKVVLKAKWKGLRDNFRVEYKRIPRSETGEFLVEPATFESKWLHYYALLFLTDHMRHRLPKSEQDQSFFFTQQSQDCEKTVVEPDLTNGLIRRMQDSDEEFDEDDIADDEDDDEELTDYSKILNSTTKPNILLGSTILQVPQAPITPPAAHANSVPLATTAGATNSLYNSEESRAVLLNSTSNFLLSAVAVAADLDKEVQDLSKKSVMNHKNDTTNHNNVCTTNSKSENTKANVKNKILEEGSLSSSPSSSSSSSPVPLSLSFMLPSISLGTSSGTESSIVSSSSATSISHATITTTSISTIPKTAITTDPATQKCIAQNTTRITSTTSVQLPKTCSTPTKHINVGNLYNNANGNVNVIPVSSAYTNLVELTSNTNRVPINSAIAVHSSTDRFSLQQNCHSHKKRSVSPPPLYNKAHHSFACGGVTIAAHNIHNKERDDYTLSSSSSHDNLSFANHNFVGNMMPAIKLKRSRFSEEINCNGSSIDCATGAIAPSSTLVPEDDDYHYLLSLHPYMKQLNAAQKLRLRTRIQKLIFKDLYKEDLDEHKK